ncbi:MarR family transcriptional regulator [Candidatus Woesearchaeota archaeon]|nr:MarR family transcriptional regulator [Candidatus Woesearchaeota archaeon]
MNQKYIGIFLIVLGALLSVFVYTSKIREDAYIKEIMRQNNGSCFLEDGTCLHADRTFTIYVLGGALAVSLILFGVYLIAFDRAGKEEIKKTEKKDYTKILSELDEEEKSILIKVIEAEGTMFQSDIVEKTGYTKVKVTRILDKLEGRGIIERRRRGMTNVVIMKG